ncbi:MAG: hypothetical protein H6Q73_1418 [Firmicutes bacterium]|nr:hypothetical protein [Bacillota bacterium]
MQNLSRYFVSGMIVVVPIAITAFAVYEILNITEAIFGRYLPVRFPGLSLLVSLIVIFIIGWLSSYWLPQRLIALGEWLLSTIPIVKFIYNSVKQLSTAVFESDRLLKQAVLVPYPHPGVKALGFVISELPEHMACHFDEENVCVFVPMSVNMTTGFNIIVPKRDIIALDVTSESALQYVLTAGAVMPRHEDGTKS